MMNERIRELAEQAHVYADGHSLLCHEGDIKKFAELIVQECANFIDSKLERDDEIYSCADGEDLRQHFGVEE